LRLWLRLCATRSGLWEQTGCGATYEAADGRLRYGQAVTILARNPQAWAGQRHKHRKQDSRSARRIEALPSGRCVQSRWLGRRRSSLAVPRPRCRMTKQRVAGSLALRIRRRIRTRTPGPPRTPGATLCQLVAGTRKLQRNSSGATKVTCISDRAKRLVFAKTDVWLETGARRDRADLRDACAKRFHPTSHTSRS
jgi:hypothetical protein